MPAKGVDRSHKGDAAPAVTFKDPDGGDISLSEFDGVPVLVNLWATWCAPCVKELPTLDALAKSHAVDGELGVIAVSQDNGPLNSVRAFLKLHGITDLGAYHDPDMALSAALGVQVMPTTILYDKDGREVWRFVGDLDWTSAQAKALLAEAGAFSPAATH
ncbi:MAG: TlpA disulfide reductase family protein [Sphingomicrobium sp.]